MSHCSETLAAVAEAKAMRARKMELRRKRTLAAYRRDKELTPNAIAQLVGVGSDMVRRWISESGE